VQFGTDLIRTGWIAEMRKQVGVSLNVLAGWLGSNGHHVSRWETGDVKFVQYRSAARIVKLCDAHRAANEWLGAEKLTWDQVTPLRSAAQTLGIAVSTMRSRLTARDREPIDFGLMGEWIERTEVALCRK
jgi:hypothetical protein